MSEGCGGCAAVDSEKWTVDVWEKTGMINSLSFLHWHLHFHSHYSVAHTHSQRPALRQKTIDKVG